MTPANRHTGESGFGMIEVLVTLLILLVGLLGMAGLMVQSQRSEMESYQRVQALVLLQDIVGRIKANRKAAPCYAISDTTLGTPYMGNGAAATPACTAAIATGSTATEQSRALQDLSDWSALLQGAAETSSGNNVGSMIGARGCVSYDPASLTYLVTIAWQGMGTTAIPSAGVNCGKNLYGSETQRRVVSMTFKIATLS
ncbi:MAG: pilV [Herminiimonas sp.]|nr:pilV [Herminiimonas sp.]